MIESISYKGSMVDLGQMIQCFFRPLRKFVVDCELSQLIACLVMKGQQRIPHRAENNALMAHDTFDRLVKLLKHFIKP